MRAISLSALRAHIPGLALTYVLSITPCVHAATLQWLGGAHDIPAPTSPAVPCTLRVTRSDPATHPDGYYLMYEGDGQLAFHTPWGAAGQISGPAGLVGAVRYADIQSRRDTLDLGNWTSGEYEFVTVHVESGSAFTISAAEIVNGRLTAFSGAGALVTINGGPWGGTTFRPELESSSAWVDGDSLRFQVSGIHMAGVVKCLLWPARDSSQVPFHLTGDTLLAGAIPVSLARRIDTIVCVDAAGKWSSTSCPGLSILHPRGATVIAVNMSVEATSEQHAALEAVPGASQVLYSNGMTVHDLSTSGGTDPPLDPTGLTVTASDPSMIPTMLSTIRSMPGVMSADSQACFWNVADEASLDPNWLEQWSLHGYESNPGYAACDGHMYPQPGSSIRAEQAWDYAPLSTPTRIGFIDDGIQTTAYYTDMNQDSDAFAAWRSFVTQGPSEPPLTTCEQQPGCSEDGHGTKVASLAVATTAFTSSQPAYGIAGNSVVGVPVSLKFNGARATGPSNMNSAIDYGSSQLVGRGNCKIISNSNGFYKGMISSSAFLQMARVNKGAWNRGAFVVASAGNEYENIDVKPNFARYPAAFGDVVVAVGATSFAGRIWSSKDLFGASASTTGSTHGNFLSVVAPGAGLTHMLNDGTIRSINDPDCIWNEGHFNQFSGTSFAAPLVAGAAAWLLALQPTLTNDDLRRVLELSAKDLGAEGKDPIHGYGQIDMEKAAQMVLAPNWIERGAMGAGTSSPLTVGSPQATQLLLSGTANPSLDTGVAHDANRYEVYGVLWPQSEFQTEPELWIRRRESRGIDGTGIWDDSIRLPWVKIYDNLIPGSYLLQTYVYELVNFPTTSPLRWFPCPPSQVVIHYTAVGPTTVGVPVDPTGGSLAVRATSNPARGRLRLALSGVDRGPLRVELFDVAGRCQARLFEGASQGGAMNLEWDGISSGGRAAPGLYIVRVEQPGRRIACRVSYMR